MKAARLASIAALLVTVPSASHAAPPASSSSSSSNPKTPGTTYVLPGTVPASITAPTSTSSANTIAVTELWIDSPIAVLGQNLTATVRVKNLSERTLTNVEWKFVLPDGATRGGVLPEIGPQGTMKLEQIFVAHALGPQEIVFTVDGGKKIETSAAARRDDEAKGTTFVVQNQASPWTVWAQKSAAKLHDVLDAMKATARIDGKLVKSTLVIDQIDLSNAKPSIAIAILTGDGVHQKLAEAVGDALSGALGAWGSSYTATLPSAYPTFANGASLNSAKSTPLAIGIAGTSPKASGLTTAADIEAVLTLRLGKKTTEPGAADAVHVLAVSLGKQLETWLATQQISVLAKNGAIINDGWQALR